MARKKGPLADNAYEAVKEKILSFELLPGETVSDYALSRELNMSRTPIRETMQRLMGEGLIVQEENRMAVSPLTQKDVREICQVREALEQKAVDLIIGEGGLKKKQEQRLIELNARMLVYIEQHDYKMNFQMDDAFHAEILKISQNSRLISIFENLRLQIARARWLTVVQPYYEESVKEHQAILEALAGGDAKQAKDAVESHMKNAERHFSEIFSSEGMFMSMKALLLLNTKKKPD